MKPKETNAKHGDSALSHILVIGHKGMLGQALLDLARQEAISAEGLDLPEIDITDLRQVKATLQAMAPGLVINCAAYTAVDKAESESSTVFAVNRDGPGNLAEACAERRIPLIHISTDYVFDGTLDRAYSEDDRVNPSSVYGQSKWEGEEAVRSRLPEHIIIRTAWLYGVYGSNFVKTIIRLAKEREELRVVADQRGCPTSAGDLASCLLDVAGQVHGNRNGSWWGTYHYTGQGVTTWHGFAEAILEELRTREAVKLSRVIPIPTSEYPTPARRPANSALDCSKIAAVFGTAPRPWRMVLQQEFDGIMAKL